MSWQSHSQAYEESQRGTAADPASSAADRAADVATIQEQTGCTRSQAARILERRAAAARAQQNHATSQAEHRPAADPNQWASVTVHTADGRTLEGAAAEAHISAPAKPAPPAVHLQQPPTPTIPAPPKEETPDTEHASRMSIAQLRDRISQMEATDRKYSAQTFPKEKQSSRIKRREKLAAYRCELQAREAAEAKERAAQEALEREIADKAAAAAAKRAAEAQATADAIAAGATVQPIAEAAAKLAARLSIPCPQCHAPAGERCKNYAGNHCHPHGARKAPQQPAEPAQACGNCEGTGSISTPHSDAYTARGCGECHGTGQQPAPQNDATSQAHEPAITAAKCTIAEKCSHRQVDGHTCQRDATTSSARNGLPVCDQHARADRRIADTLAGKGPVPDAPESWRQPAPQPQPVRPEPAKRKTAADDDLVHRLLLPILRIYTPGAVQEAVWAADRARYLETRQ